MLNTEQKINSSIRSMTFKTGNLFGNTSQFLIKPEEPKIISNTVEFRNKQDIIGYRGQWFSSIKFQKSIHQWAPKFNYESFHRVTTLYGI